MGHRKLGLEQSDGNDTSQTLCTQDVTRKAFKYLNKLTYELKQSQAITKQTNEVSGAHAEVKSR